MYYPCLNNFLPLCGFYYTDIKFELIELIIFMPIVFMWKWHFLFFGSKKLGDFITWWCTCSRLNATRITDKSRLRTTNVMNTMQEPKRSPPSTGLPFKTWENSEMLNVSGSHQVSKHCLQNRWNSAPEGNLLYLIIIKDAYLQTDDRHKSISKGSVGGSLPAINQVALRSKNIKLVCFFFSYLRLFFCISLVILPIN